MLVRSLDDVEALPNPPSKPNVSNEAAIQESPSSTVTSAPTLSASSTPVGTPVRLNTPLQLSYHHHMKIYTSEGSAERAPTTPVLSASGDPTPITSPMAHSNSSSTKKKQRFVKFLPLLRSLKVVIQLPSTCFFF